MRAIRLTLAGVALWACAGAAMAAPAGVICPGPLDVQAGQLVGRWRAQVPGLWDEAIVELAPHPHHAGSLAGHVVRGTQRAQAVADLDEGEFTMEESADGIHIDATWLGEPVEGHCGREIRGEIRLRGQEDARTPGRPFVLRRP